jgi:hypothetical protein
MIVETPNNTQLIKVDLKHGGVLVGEGYETPVAGVKVVGKKATWRLVGLRDLVG